MNRKGATRIVLEFTSVVQYYFVDSTSGNILLVLPDATTITGKSWTIKRIASVNNVLIQPVESQTIDGAINHPLVNQWDSITIISDGSNFYITSQVN